MGKQLKFRGNLKRRHCMKKFLILLLVTLLTFLSVLGCLRTEPEASVVSSSPQNALDNSIGFDPDFDPMICTEEHNIIGSSAEIYLCGASLEASESNIPIYSKWNTPDQKDTAAADKVTFNINGKDVTGTYKTSFTEMQIIIKRTSMLPKKEKL